MELSNTQPRFKAYAKVRCQKYGSGLSCLMILKDVSKTGARLNLLTSVADFFKGDILRLVVELESVHKNRVVNAEVIWTKGGALGVSFLHPDLVVNRLLNRK